MVEIALDVHRGGFHLQVKTEFDAPCTVLFGPSGAGKTTLLRLLAGLDRGRPGESIRGQIRFNGVTLTDTEQHLWLTPGHRSIALVTQHPALFPHLNVATNVAYGIYAMERDARVAQVREMLTLVGAAELATRLPHALSGGQAQRVALARALATNPQLLLLDEPFSALDGDTSDALLERLQQWLRDHRVQAILATHDVSDALAISAEVALLQEGRLIAQGPAATVLSAERERLLTRLQ